MKNASQKPTKYESALGGANIRMKNGEILASLVLVSGFLDKHLQSHALPTFVYSYTIRIS